MTSLLAKAWHLICVQLLVGWSNHLLLSVKTIVIANCQRLQDIISQKKVGGWDWEPGSCLFQAKSGKILLKNLVTGGNIIFQL